MKLASSLLFLALASLLVFACQSTVLHVGPDACKTDADCVPATCCHATECTVKSKVQACNVACTDNCQHDSLDCGGSCLCSDGHCAAHYVE